ncbi:unnamed protein product [Angiostrongylus costaricensis]|uniref:Uncharacterized protein n=1 Tax=Angiostrongylus costaricensis TaxID=334426 RepID=A0A0R3PY18_ANGCS|nr:unnamed protein product [Angiostrongylus costaricensis]
MMENGKTRSMDTKEMCERAHLVATLDCTLSLSLVNNHQPVVSLLGHVLEIELFAAMETTIKVDPEGMKTTRCDTSKNMDRHVPTQAICIHCWNTPPDNQTATEPVHESYHFNDDSCRTEG